MLWVFVIIALTGQKVEKKKQKTSPWQFQWIIQTFQDTDDQVGKKQGLIHW